MAGALVGLLTFGVGIAMLAITFTYAFEVFRKPPTEAIGIQANQPLDVNETGRLGITLVYRILLLLVMCLLASVIASRGIKLYGASVAAGGRVLDDEETVETA